MKNRSLAFVVTCSTKATLPLITTDVSSAMDWVLHQRRTEKHRRRWSGESRSLLATSGTDLGQAAALVTTNDAVSMPTADTL